MATDVMNKLTGIFIGLTPKKVIGGCLTFILFSVGMAGALFHGVVSVLKSSDAYKTGLQSVQNSSEVVAIIGEPVEAGFWLVGSVEVNGGSGKANLSFPISGSNGSGKVHVVGKKTAGTWEYSTINFHSDTNEQTIDLLSPSDAPE